MFGRHFKDKFEDRELRKKQSSSRSRSVRSVSHHREKGKLETNKKKRIRNKERPIYYCSCMWQNCEDKFEEKRYIFYQNDLSEFLNALQMPHLLTKLESKGIYNTRGLRSVDKKQLASLLFGWRYTAENMKQVDAIYKALVFEPDPDLAPVTREKYEQIIRSSFSKGGDSKRINQIKDIFSLIKKLSAEVYDALINTAPSSESRPVLISDFLKKVEMYYYQIEDFVKKHETEEYISKKCHSLVENIIPDIRKMQKIWSPKSINKKDDLWSVEFVQGYNRVYTYMDSSWRISDEIQNNLLDSFQKITYQMPSYKNWIEAPLAVQYCPSHLKDRVRIFKSLGMGLEQAQTAANANWLLFHPETDPSARTMLVTWLNESKNLYSLLREEDVSYEKLLKKEIKQIYCVENKLSRYGRYSFCENPKAKILQLHGTQQHVLSSILETDLLLSGEEVGSSTGAMLGHGVYMTESFLKAIHNSPHNDGSSWIFVLEIEFDEADTTTYADVKNQSESRKSLADIIVAKGQAIFTEKNQVDSGWTRGCYFPSRAELNRDVPFRIPYSDNKLLFSEILVRNPKLWRIRYLLYVQ